VRGDGAHAKARLECCGRRAVAAAPADRAVSPIIALEIPLRSDPSRARITAHYAADESTLAQALAERAALDPAGRDAVSAQAAAFVERVRARAGRRSAVESLLAEYDLSSEEGVLLMCIAEALARIPDARTADRLIADKLGEADWGAHLGHSESLAVNASTFGLMLTGRLVALARETRRDPWAAFKRLVARLGEPVIRLGLRHAMQILGQQFVMGRTIAEALARSRDEEHRLYRHSFDMLGEAALSTADARRYFEAYRAAIGAIGAQGPWRDLRSAPSVSVKLSALHPRYEHAKRARVMAELVPALLALATLARAAGIALTVDAEESERLELSLDVLDAVAADPALAGWEGLGLAVQAYQKRALPVIDWLAERARALGRPWCLRLVKGAYWDSEIKRAQVEGHAGYPVFTRKVTTDVSYLACARRLLEHGELFHPQFATHNAHTVAAVLHLARGREFEFQRLHGMGADLYAEVLALGVPCRVYAPVGGYEDLLPYLVRRLLENGANTSFVHRIADPAVPVAQLAADPVEQLRALEAIAHPRIPLPVRLFGEERKNSMGVNFANDDELAALAAAVNAAPGPWEARPLVPGWTGSGAPVAVTDPADRRRVIGRWESADAGAVALALANAVAAQPEWDCTPAAARAQVLERAADLLEARRGEFIALCVREAGKTIPDSVAEVREAVDCLRYYAAQGRRLFGAPQPLAGPTGESNELHLRGRGVFAAISPWNFPLAIFTGQVSAALMAGNSVIAKPAEQTTLIAYRAVKLLHEAGVPEAVLQLVPGDGPEIGGALVRDARLAGVVFTGATETARAIHRALAAREAAIATLIAETAGQNAVIADSSALPEQLVRDTIVSAFNSAGQRCSAARVLFVQEEIAERVIGMLAGAMDELEIGDPGRLSTDIGPVIDEDACRMLAAHAARMDREAKLIRALEPGPECAHGTFFGPRAYEIASVAQLEREVFGPILHVVRYPARDLDRVIDAINATGYGLTLGIHSRLDSTVERIFARARVGNVYVNRNIIGAVVGVQPFGGEGLSGTGPKAGGPHYLPRFAVERTLTINTAAAGGNAALLTLAA
jgi:RHH-type proline utilization regulon transcriptional repressor/proline dehydrogenase/delta 1-pyrroline-5-carboxylate dehydrogenase